MTFIHENSASDAALQVHRNGNKQSLQPGLPAKRPVRPRLATAALFLANGLGIGTWAGALPALQQQLGLSNQMLSVALVGFAVGAVASMLVAARCAGRFGVAQTALAAAFAFAVALVLPPLAPDLVVLAGAAVLLGLSNGFLDVCMNTNATTVERAWGVPLMSSFHALFSLGGMAGALGISFMLRLGVGLVGSMVIAAGVAAALTVSSLGVGLRRGLAMNDVATEVPLWRWPDPVVMRIGALAFLAMLVEGAMADWSGVFMTEVTGVSAAIAATAYAAFAVAMVAGRVFGDRIVRGLGPARVLGIGGVTVCAAMLVAIALPQRDIARVCFAVAGLGLSNLIPVLFSAGARVKPERPEEGVAGAAMGGYAGFLFGPVIIGSMAQVIGLRLALLLLAVAAAILAALAPRLVRFPKAKAG